MVMGVRKRLTLYLYICIAVIVRGLPSSASWQDLKVRIVLFTAY